MLGVGRTTAYELIARGKLQVVHVGRSARVPLVAVHRNVDGLMSPLPRKLRSAPARGALLEPRSPRYVFSLSRRTGWTRDGARVVRPTKAPWTGLDQHERLGGGERNRTAVEGFAGPCLNHSATPPGDGAG